MAQFTIGNGSSYDTIINGNLVVNYNMGGITSVTVPSTNWNSNTNEVTVNGITANTLLTCIGPTYTSNSTTNTNIDKAFKNIWKMETGTNKITFYATAVPTQEFTLNFYGGRAYPLS